MGAPWNIPPQRVFSARRTTKEYKAMDNILVIQPLVALIAGVLILIMPRLLNYVVAIYLIVIGVLGLWPQLGSLGT
jgi:hypothetical protein